MTILENEVRNLSDILKFLDYLRENSVKFDVKQSRPDSLMVTFTVVLFRVEVDFFSDHIEFSYFTGDESVKDNLNLLDLIVREDPLRLQELGILPQSITLNRDI
jgi:hypothetical protein